MSDLYQKVCKYLIYNEINNNAALSNSMLKESLARRESDKAFLDLYRRDALKTTTDAGSDADFYFYRYRDEFTYLNYYLPRQKRTGERPLEASASNLDLFYVVRKLQLLCEAINSRNILTTSVDFFLKDEIVTKLKEGHFANIPLVGIYYRILKTLTNPDDEVNFSELKALLDRQTDVFSESDLRDMYQYLMNYCIRKINLGETHFVSELFQVYQKVLDLKLLFNNGFLSQWDYKNIVAVSVRSNNIKWAEKFILQYKSHLHEGEREKCIYIQSGIPFSC